MEQIEKAIEVGVPVRAAYNQWTQFEDYIEKRGVETGGWRGEVKDSRPQ